MSTKDKSKIKAAKTSATPAPEAVLGNAEPSMVFDLYHTARASTRRNAAATIVRSDQYKNISDAPIPFKSRSRNGGGSTISISEAIELVQRAYFNFPVLKNVIDVMTEFSVGKIHFRGGTAKSREFFEAYIKKLKMWQFEDQFFREYYRGGNVFIYKMVANLQPDDVRKITNAFGAEKVKSSPEIPTRYTILNACDIESTGSSNFIDGSYIKILNEYEISRLKNPKTDEDKKMLESLPAEARNQLKNNSGYGSEIYIHLDGSKMRSVFYKKQDYEPFGVPMAWSVLKDLSAKEEMKQIDMALARIMQQSILLVTTGTEPEKGGVNPKHVSALNKLFENQSVCRVLVADYTTDAKFVIPDVSQILTPEKYAILDNDINIGLNNIFTGGEKFANQSAKVEVFIERLKHGREAFLNDFLIPEMNQVAEAVGFRDWPTPEFEELDVKDSGAMDKIYVELAKIGYLTPQETFKAFKSGQLPDDDTSYENQVEHKDRKDKGYYAPQIGGKGEETGSLGRPKGSSGPKTSNPITPMGAKTYSVKAVKENFIKASQLEVEVEKEYRKSNNLRKLKEADELIVDQITKTIIANETPDKWLESVKEYSENPADKNQDRINQVCEVASEHGVDFFLASILLASKKK